MRIADAGNFNLCVFHKPTNCRRDYAWVSGQAFCQRFFQSVRCGTRILNTFDFLSNFGEVTAIAFLRIQNSNRQQGEIIALLVRLCLQTPPESSEHSQGIGLLDRLPNCRITERCLLPRGMQFIASLGDLLLIFDRCRQCPQAGFTETTQFIASIACKKRRCITLFQQGLCEF